MLQVVYSIANKNMAFMDQLMGRGWDFVTECLVVTKITFSKSRFNAGHFADKLRVVVKIAPKGPLTDHREYHMQHYERANAVVVRRLSNDDEEEAYFGGS